MADIFDKSRPALNADGTLKDASEMEWLDSPSQETGKLSNTVQEPDSPTLESGKSQGARPKLYYDHQREVGPDLRGMKML